MPVGAAEHELDRLAGGARGLEDAHRVIRRNTCEIAPGRVFGLALLQLLLGGQGDALQILHFQDLFGGDFGGLEFALVKRAFGDDISHLVTQLCQLVLFNLFAGQAFRCLVPIDYLFHSPPRFVIRQTLILFVPLQFLQAL